MAGHEIAILPATDRHAHALAPRMRAGDAAEVMASNGYTPIGACLAALGVSSYARTLLIDGEVAAMWGVAPANVLTGLGSAWLLTTDIIDRHRRLFVRLSRLEVKRLLQMYSTIFQFVDARYRAALRWAEAIGFTVGPPHPLRPGGPLFCLIAMEAPHV